MTAPEISSAEAIVVLARRLVADQADIAAMLTDLRHRLDGCGRAAMDACLTDHGMHLTPPREAGP